VTARKKDRLTEELPLPNIFCWDLHIKFTLLPARKAHRRSNLGARRRCLVIATAWPL